MGHLSESDLEGFVAGRLDARERRRVVRHLLSDCAVCRSRWPAVERRREEQQAYDACIDRARAAIRSWEKRWQKEVERRDRGLAIVHAKGWANLNGAERRSLRGGWAGVEILLGASFEARFRDPDEMLDLAEQAQKAAGRLKSGLLGESPLRDLRARVEAELGNALRVNEFFLEAEAAIKRARSLLMVGFGDLLVKARVDDVEASLRNAQRRLAKAELLLARAHRAYLKLGEHHLAGRALMTRGICLRIAGRPLDGIQHLKKALTLLDAKRDSQLVAAAQHNLLDALADAGRFHEAGQVLLESGLRQRFCGDSLNLLRLRWVEAKIMAGRGRLADAERVLGEVRAGFRERGLEFVASVVGVDLAKVLLERGKLGPLHELARDLLKAAQERRLQAPVRSALASLEVVCEFQVATVPMVENVRRFLNQLEHEPTLRWDPELLLAAQ